MVNAGLETVPGCVVRRSRGFLVPDTIRIWNMCTVYMRIVDGGYQLVFMLLYLGYLGSSELGVRMALAVPCVAVTLSRQDRRCDTGMT